MGSQYVVDPLFEPSCFIDSASFTYSLKQTWAILFVVCFHNLNWSENLSEMVASGFSGWICLENNKHILLLCKCQDAILPFYFPRNQFIVL
jgi:hypothetical protein